MKLTVLPKKKLSKWSFWFFIASVLSFVLFFLLITVFDQKGGDTFFSNTNLTIPILLAFLTSFLAFISGLYSIIFQKGRSISVFLTTLIGLLVTLYGLMEILFTH